MCISTLLDFQAEYFILHIFFSSETILEKKHFFFLVSLSVELLCYSVHL